MPERSISSQVRRAALLAALALPLLGIREVKADPPPVPAPIHTDIGNFLPGIPPVELAPIPIPTPEAAPLPSRFIERGNPDRPEIALTLDGGAGARNTPDILAILKEKDVKATMFLAGRWMDENPDLVRQMITDGHVIVNHSWDHLSDFRDLSDDQIRDQLRRTETKAQELGISTTKPYFRPPFGGFDDRVIRICTEEGFTQFVYWTYDSGDWIDNLPPGQVYNRIVGNASNGAIYVMHLDSWQEPIVLGAEIDALRDLGFSLVTLPYMMRD